MLVLRPVQRRINLVYAQITLWIMSRADTSCIYHSLIHNTQESFSPATRGAIMLSRSGELIKNNCPPPSTPSPKLANTCHMIHRLRQEVTSNPTAQTCLQRGNALLTLMLRGGWLWIVLWGEKAYNNNTASHGEVKDSRGRTHSLLCTHPFYTWLRTLSETDQAFDQHSSLCVTAKW